MLGPRLTTAAHEEKQPLCGAARNTYYGASPSIMKGPLFAVHNGGSRAFGSDVAGCLKPGMSYLVGIRPLIVRLRCAAVPQHGSPPP
jgi:hypothetical protein